MTNPPTNYSTNKLTNMKCSHRTPSRTVTEMNSCFNKCVTHDIAKSENLEVLFLHSKPFTSFKTTTIRTTNSTSFTKWNTCNILITYNISTHAYKMQLLTPDRLSYLKEIVEFGRPGTALGTSLEFWLPWGSLTTRFVVFNITSFPSRPFDSSTGTRPS